MHLHGFGFRVLRRQGITATRAGSRPSWTDAWRPTSREGHRGAVAERDAVAALDFTLRRRPRSAVPALHVPLHNLEHEDGMMMRNFSVIERGLHDRTHFCFF